MDFEVIGCFSSQKSEVVSNQKEISLESKDFMKENLSLHDFYVDDYRTKTDHSKFELAQQTLMSDNDNQNRTEVSFLKQLVFTN